MERCMMEINKEKTFSLIKLISENMDKGMSFTRIYPLKLNPNVQVVEFISKTNGKTGKILVGNHKDRIIIDVLADSSDIIRESTPQVVMQDIKNEALREITKWLIEYQNN
jgi:hypothetical protein